MGFLNWLWGFWNWFSNLIRFKNANHSISSSKESTDRSWHELFMEMCKISSLDTPSRLRSKVTKIPLVEEEAGCWVTVYILLIWKPVLEMHIITLGGCS